MPIIIAILICIVVLIGWLGIVPPPYATILIRIDRGSIDVRKGRLRPHAREHVADIVRDSQVSKGYVAVTPANRIVFSRQIPMDTHQRLRNVLLNQWA